MAEGWTPKSHGTFKGVAMLLPISVLLVHVVVDAGATHDNSKLPILNA